MFSEYFHSTFRQSNSFAHSSQLYTGDKKIPQTVANMGSIEVKETQVLTLQKGLDLNKSAGPDLIPPIFIVKCAESLVVPLSLLFKLSLDLGELPPVWKQA